MRQCSLEAGYFRPRVNTATELWEREKLQSLIDAAKRREIGLVVIHTFDRASRHMGHRTILEDVLAESGVRVAYVTSQFNDDPDSLGARTERFVSDIGADYANEARKRDSLKGKRGRVLEKGYILPGNRPLFGYAFDDDAPGQKHRYVIDPVSSEWVRLIFEAIASGEKVLHLCRRLEALGIPTRGQYAGLSRARGVWDPANIRQIICNESYQGRYAAFKMQVVPVPVKQRPNYRHKSILQPTTPDAWLTPKSSADDVPVCPAIVSPELARAAQAVMARNKVSSPRNGNDKDIGLLRFGVARCALCGGVLGLQFRAFANRVNEKRNYVCRQGRRSHGCKGVSISQRALDAAVWGQFRDSIFNEDFLADMIRDAESETNSAANAQLRTLTAEFEAVDRQLSNAVKELLLASSDIVREKLRERQTELERDHARLRKAIVAAQADTLTGAEQRALVRQFAERFAGDFREWMLTPDGPSMESKRALLRALDAAVIVWPEVERTPRAVLVLHIRKGVQFPRSQLVETLPYAENANSQSSVVTMIQHDLYHAGEINHLRALHQRNDPWE